MAHGLTDPADDAFTDDELRALLGGVVALIHGGALTPGEEARIEAALRRRAGE